MRNDYKSIKLFVCAVLVVACFAISFSFINERKEAADSVKEAEIAIEIAQKEVQVEKAENTVSISDYSENTDLPAYQPTEELMATMKMGSVFKAYLHLGNGLVSEPVAVSNDPAKNISQIYRDGEWRDTKKGGTIVMEDMAWGKVLYGHNMRSGALFGNLRKYVQNASNEEALKELGLEGTFETEEGIKNLKVLVIANKNVQDDENGIGDLYKISDMNEFRDYFRGSERFGSVDNISDDKEIITLQTCETSTGRKNFIFLEVL